ncbi:hypothetical protein Agub_g14591 [Astrephomene gubernaculifera]|uniref:Guanylate cyclase domain-containing protein n=1 Tax=Astrephomene gubernaculifera TaxID=47775 RepID=A0AAD3HSE1_9CHLO|nr:hypothetical protein Agub_g14591 [Astrephomene gubernaculifera]
MGAIVNRKPRHKKVAHSTADKDSGAFLKRTLSLVTSCFLVPRSPSHSGEDDHPTRHAPTQSEVRAHNPDCANECERQPVQLHNGLKSSRAEITGAQDACLSLYQALIDASPQYICVYDERTRRLILSNAASKGLPGGSDTLDSLFALDPQSLADAIERVKDGQSWRGLIQLSIPNPCQPAASAELCCLPLALSRRGSAAGIPALSPAVSSSPHDKQLEPAGKSGMLLKRQPLASMASFSLRQALTLIAYPNARRYGPSAAVAAMGANDCGEVLSAQSLPPSGLLLFDLEARSSNRRPTPRPSRSSRRLGTATTLPPPPPPATGTKVTSPEVVAASSAAMYTISQATRAAAAAKAAAAAAAAEAAAVVGSVGAVGGGGGISTACASGDDAGYATAVREDRSVREPVTPPSMLRAPSVLRRETDLSALQDGAQDAIAVERAGSAPAGVASGGVHNAFTAGAVFVPLSGLSGSHRGVDRECQAKAGDGGTVATTCNARTVLLAAHPAPPLQPLSATALAAAHRRCGLAYPVSSPHQSSVHAESSASPPLTAATGAATAPAAATAASAVVSAATGAGAAPTAPKAELLSPFASVPGYCPLLDRDRDRDVDACSSQTNLAKMPQSLRLSRNASPSQEQLMEALTTSTWGARMSNRSVRSVRQSSACGLHGRGCSCTALDGGAAVQGRQDCHLRQHMQQQQQQQRQQQPVRACGEGGSGPGGGAVSNTESDGELLGRLQLARQGSSYEQQQQQQLQHAAVAAQEALLCSSTTSTDSLAAAAAAAAAASPDVCSHRHQAHTGNGYPASRPNSQFHHSRQSYSGFSLHHHALDGAPLGNSGVLPRLLGLATKVSCRQSRLREPLDRRYPYSTQPDVSGRFVSRARSGSAALIPVMTSAAAAAAEQEDDGGASPAPGVATSAEGLASSLFGNGRCFASLGALPELRERCGRSSIHLRTEHETDNSLTLGTIASSTLSSGDEGGDADGSGDVTPPGQSEHPTEAPSSQPHLMHLTPQLQPPPQPPLASHPLGPKSAATASLGADLDSPATLSVSKHGFLQTQAAQQGGQARGVEVQEGHTTFGSNVCGSGQHLEDLSCTPFAAVGASAGSTADISATVLSVVEGAEPLEAAAGTGTAAAGCGGDGGGSGIAPPLEMERWHEVVLSGLRHPVSGEQLILVTQHDVSARVWAEQQLARVMEAEHAMLEAIFPAHVLEHVAIMAAANGEAEGLTARPTIQRLEAEAQAAALQAGLTGLHGCAGGLPPGAPALPPACPGGAAPPAVPIITGDTFLHLSTSHSALTVLFCDIQGFTAMCNVVKPATVMAFLNDLYTRLDAMLDAFGVYKVETIGDCYMVAGGLMKVDEETGAVTVRSDDVDPQHAHRTVHFAKALLRAASAVRLPTTGEPVRLRVGIHSGPAMSGVVGTRMPRFCLFGDTINTASRMESTGVPGAIHVSAATRDLVPGEPWEATGGVQAKGKGLLQTFLLRPPLEPW